MIETVQFTGIYSIARQTACFTLAGAQILKLRVGCRSIRKIRGYSVICSAIVNVVGIGNSTAQICEVDDADISISWIAPWLTLTPMVTVCMRPPTRIH